MNNLERIRRIVIEKGENSFGDDAERIYQSTAFRRLAGVTQVITATESGVYHNRLTHSIKVSRMARLIAHRLKEKEKNDKKIRQRIAELGGLDVSVVEAASLAHDIGHPPFGHCGEDELDKLVKEYGYANKSEKEFEELEGFEGNAQSLRVVTKLIPRHTSPDIKGLNLTRATLNALMKYPWLKQSNNKKYGVYRTELKEFEWTRQPENLVENRRTLEAEIMDWADDVAYAFHDFEDFVQAELIDLGEIYSYHSSSKTNGRTPDFVQYIKQHETANNEETLEEAFLAFVELTPFIGPRSKILPRKQKRSNNEVFASLREQYIKFFDVDSNNEDYVSLKSRNDIEVLKKFTEFYVINSRSLQTQQHGYRVVLRYIFEAFFEASEEKKYPENMDDLMKATILPRDFWELYWELYEENESNTENLSDKYIRARVIADCISRMTDQEALVMYGRLSGNAPGSVFDRLR